MSPAVDIHAAAYSLRIAGTEMPDDLAGALTGWRVTQQLSRPSVCELQFLDLPATSLGSLQLGAACELADSSGATFFSGSVTFLRREKRADGLHILVARAHDELEPLRRRQVMAVREPATLASMLSSLVDGIGLKVEANDPGPTLPLILQWGANDLDWAANLCATYGQYFYLEGRTLRLMSLHGRSGPAVELDIDTELFDAWIECNALGLRTEAKASSWNPLNTESHSATAIDFTLEAEAGWESAPPELKDVARHIVGGAGPQEPSALTLVAQADLDRAWKRAHHFGGLSEGNSRLAPGVRVRLTGTDSQFSGEFALTSVEHSYKPDSGYVCSLSSLPPADPARPIGPAISLGIVSSTADPAQAGRVKVILKAFNDAQSDWLNVCTPGAGQSKGLIAQPEEGDTVVVAFANENPAQGVVLGGLFGAAALHDADAAANRPRPYTLRTRSGQQLRMDDETGALRLSSRGGKLDLDPQGVALEASADLRISAPGRRITIVADRIDFRKG
jgi:phage baseplate assembly protein gpV